MKTTCSRKLLGGLALLAALCLPAIASATIAGTLDSTTLTLGTPNADLSRYAGPYATVEIDRLSTSSAEIIVTGLSANGVQYMMGDGGSIALSTNGGAATASGFHWTGGVNDTDYSQVSAGNVSDFGRFNMILKGFDGYTRAVTSLSFLLTNDSQVVWDSAADVLAKNGAGFMAASHIFPTGLTNSTGFAADSDPVPEPGTMMLLGAGFLGLAVYGKRRRNA